MDEGSKRRVFNERNINIRYIVNNIPISGKLKLNSNDNLESSFKKFKKIKKIKKPKNTQKESEFHLIRNNKKILLDKNIKTEKLEIKEGDLISVSYKEKTDNNNEINDKNINNDNIYNNRKNKFDQIKIINYKQKKYILLFSFLIIILAGLGFYLTYHFLKKDKKDNKDNKNTNYNKEELITKKRPYYPINTLFLYKSDKAMKITLESDLERISDEKDFTNIKEYMNYGLIIRNEYQDIYEELNMTKKWYSGYISLLNLTINNGTHNLSLNYNEEIHKYINKFKNKYVQNFRNLNEITDSKISSDVKELCFIKINFYENGDIKDIFIPKEFNIENMVYINKIIKLIIPKLSKNLYSENITEQIELIEKISNETNETDVELEFENVEENLENISQILRRNTENDTERDFIYENIKENELDIENYNSSISKKRSPKYYLKGISENTTFSNITDYEMENLESVQAELEGSKLKKIKNSFLDEKGMLVFISEYENITIIQPNKESLNDLTEDEDKLKSEIYNDNNEIKRNDEEDFSGKNITFNLSSIKSENINNISLNNIINDEEFMINIFKFFDNFTYIKYNQTNNDELTLRLLKEFKDDLIEKNENISTSEIEVEHTKLLKRKAKRKLTSTSYYGMKNFEKEKVLFKYNLIGLILEGIVVSKIDVSTGKCDNYFKMTIGFISFKIKFKSMQSNLHIIIKNTHQMTYNFMGLLYFSNEDLKIRNKIYSEIILDLEKNASKLLEKYYDYSGLFRDSLNNLYNQVKNFSGDFFNELIELIEKVYDNYTLILKQTENDEYEILNQIRNVTKNEYINYINNMFDIIIYFKNDTLTFLYNIKNEVDKIQIFVIDILYDIFDIIYDGILVFKEFIKKLFKAVERGVTNFKYDVRDFMEEVIGQLLYLTDFLSVNINKNEILKNAIDIEKRNRVTNKLKNFRNIILRIIEILNSNIINDYEQEMSLDNEYSIKYQKENIIILCIEEIDNKSIYIIEEIKLKIKYMNMYETYANNIQIINGITNKSFIEYNNDIYDNILINIEKISPEYLDKDSDLIKDKNYLFFLSNNISNTINQEINDINNYIEKCSSSFIFENNYNFDYNMNNFKKYFTNEYINSLFNDFKSLILEALQVHYIEIIKTNYDILYEYMEDVLNNFNKSAHLRILGTAFINTYNNLKGTFQEMAYLPSSEEFLNFIEYNFYNVSNFVLDYINEKVSSINKYYFNEKNKNNFYKLDLFQQEIDKLSNNINNFFNEIKLETDIKQKILNITFNEISVLNKEKEKKLNDLYDEIYKLAEDVKINNNKDCDILKLIKRKKRKWYTLWISYKIVYYFYCQVKIESRNNTNNIIKNLTIIKKNLSQKFSNLIENYVDKFSPYLINYVKYNTDLYDNLYNYTEEKIQNNENIQSLLNDYQNVFNNILINNNEEKLIEKICLSNDYDNSVILNIMNKFQSNLFEINNTYYKNYYLKENQLFLEYPDEIIFKINQSVELLKDNNKIIKNKINFTFLERLKNVFSSTKIFINNINPFNLDYIISKIKTDDIFSKYFNNKLYLIKSFFNSSLNYTDDNYNNNINRTILNEENFDYLINNIENNYSDFSLYLINEISENFTNNNCSEFFINNSIYENDNNIYNNSIIKNCSNEKYSTELNYSKYNFNIVKFRTEISNSRKFPEMFNQLFDDLNYNKLINFNEIIELDDITNNKNILYIYNETKYNLKLIKDGLYSLIQETFEDFGKDFTDKTNLTK